MLGFNGLVTICLVYVGILFLVAGWADRRARKGTASFLSSPIIYTLSISVYCTGWTFYGAVGSAARNGLEFVTIYLGPTLVFVGWWWLLRRLVRIGRTQRITSIADLISSRYGNNNLLAVIVTLLCVIGSTPYIALQLKSLTLSFSIFAADTDGLSPSIIGFWLAVGLALFTIVFGTRSIDANERHHGVVTAIALEAVVKMAALLAVGVFVVWGLSDGPADILSKAPDVINQSDTLITPRWVTLTFLAATAIICLPRMFQVVVVENTAEAHLATASWAFPLYLFFMSLFVLPIAIGGSTFLPASANPDLFVVSLPLAFDQFGLATLAFLGGFSAATSMVIVAAIALSTMISTHIVLPLWIRANQDRNPQSDDVRSMLLVARRISIIGILALGYLYYTLTDGTAALASIGLIAFLGVAQLLPSILGGLFWNNATRHGAITGILSGFAIWAYTLFLPSFEGRLLLTEAVLQNGPFRIAWLRPEALFGSNIEDPLVHATLFSIGVNALLFITVSLLSVPSASERLQAVRMVSPRVGEPRFRAGEATTVEDLYILAQRILGRQEAKAFFEQFAAAQGRQTGLPSPTDDLMRSLERELAGTVGSATAHAMLAQAVGSEDLSFEDLFAMADETAEIMEYSQELELRSRELADTAAKLRLVNQKLTDLSAQKDAFLSQVSHELRTPMTSIRAFAEILRDTSKMKATDQRRFASIILDESVRLTRLLDEILDLSFLESGSAKLNISKMSMVSVVNKALLATEALADGAGVTILTDIRPKTLRLETDVDRLSQVLINLVSNAVKYGEAKTPIVKITARLKSTDVVVSVSDNGPGIPAQHQHLIFEKFARFTSQHEKGSAGLGLAISKEIMRNLGGDLRYLAKPVGATFQLTVPQRRVVEQPAAIAAQ
ncbi:MAG: sensor histidine kinase [Pseudomonadota bacterium]